MNCPGALYKFINKDLKVIETYRFLLSEFGKVHRYEPSGALHGLMRVQRHLHKMMHIYFVQKIKLPKKAKRYANLVLKYL